jgi:hypothetical protein
LEEDLIKAGIRETGLDSGLDKTHTATVNRVVPQQAWIIIETGRRQSAHTVGLSRITGPVVIVLNYPRFLLLR